jgi:hypothetical protein
MASRSKTSSVGYESNIKGRLGSVTTAINPSALIATSPKGYVKGCSSSVSPVWMSPTANQVSCRE